jgi:four helix bundle protein
MKATTKGEALMSTFQALDAALKLIRILRPIVERLRQKNPSLADQITNAASSAGANLGEGRRRVGRDRIQRFRIADGSADEVRVHLLVALAWGWLDEGEIAPAWPVLDSLLAMTWTLTH